MIGPRYGALLGLGAALFIADTRLELGWSLLNKACLMGAGWLVTGGWETVYIVLRTLPRDLKAVTKMVQLVYGTKRAEQRDMTVPKLFSETVSRCPDKVLFYLDFNFM